MTLLLLLLACTDPEESAPEKLSLTPLPCTAPVDTLTYREVGESWGLVDTTVPTDLPASGGAVGLADFDGDGDDDVLVAKEGEGLWLHFNEGGSLTPTLILEHGSVGTFTTADIDGDEDLDLWVASYERPENAPSPMFLLRNDGAGQFEDITAGSGLEHSSFEPMSGTFADFDGDENLDLAIARNFVGGDPPGRNLLFRNTGLGTFEDITDTLPEVAQRGASFIPLWLDHDLDGDQDLYFSNDLQEQYGASVLLENAGGEFTDISDTCFCDATVNSMGGSVGDHDNDGLIDLFITSTGPLGLYANLGDGGFSDRSYASEVYTIETYLEMACGSAFYDADNDGLLDLLVAMGRQGASTPEEMANQATNQPDLLLDFNGTIYTDTGASRGVDNQGDGRGVTVGLLNGDSFPDALVGNTGSPARLYVAECTEAAGLVVELRSPGGNPYAVGARLVLETSEGQQTRVISTTTGWSGTTHPRAHFGLGEAEAYTLTINWPSGTVQDLDLPADASGSLWVEEP